MVSWYDSDLALNFTVYPLQADELAQLLRRQGMNFEDAQELQQLQVVHLRSVTDVQLD